MIEKKLMIRGHQVNIQMTGHEQLPVLVFLHGFTGATTTWTDVMKELEGQFKMVAIDLIGHGKTAIPTDVSRYTMEEQLKDLEQVFECLDLTTFTLVGYSMGGRIALGYTIKYQARVEALILESSSPGLKTEEERRIRQEADAKLAKRIQVDGIQKFVDFWEDIPLFASQKNMSIASRQKVREERLLQSGEGLANSLKGIGTGSQPSYWALLNKIKIPVLLITGEIDEKFVDISREMKEILPNATSKMVKNVGHAIHVENPSVFATIVKEHINKLNNLGRQ